jgi:hypothetical protein
MTGKGRPQRGSVLILVPATVLVLLVLGVIAVDSSVAYLARRQLADFTASAADRAAAIALDKPAFYGSGQLRIDPEAAQLVVDGAEVAAQRDGLDITSVNVTIGPAGRSVTVAASATARAVFGLAVGGQATFTVRASTTTDVTEVMVAP